MQDLNLDKKLMPDKGQVKVKLKRKYLEEIIEDQEVKNFIEKNIQDYEYSFKIDVPVYIKKQFVMAIECKSYSENAMIKRTLFDGTLIKEKHPKAEIVLFQLESQLGGDYSNIFKEKIFGAPSTHTLMSCFDYRLHIITLLEGERKVDKPIHDPAFFKKLTKESLEKVKTFFKEVLIQYK